MDQSDTLRDLHQAAIEEFDRIQTALRNERMMCLEDRRFCAITGAQWEGPLTNQFENKPKLEINKIQPAVNRIITEYRNNRIDVSFVSKDGSEYDELSDTCAGLYRADVIDCNAEEAFDNAFEEGVTGGFGAFRLRSEYQDPEDEDDDRQRILIEPIYDADTSVFFDLQAKRQDKADATSCYVIISMTHAAFEERFGVAPSTWGKPLQQTYFDWTTPDVVYVAEYYRLEEFRDTVYVYESPLLEAETVKVKKSQDDFKEAVDNLIGQGFVLKSQKKLKSKRVHKYILCGNCVLEDCGIIAGKHIPVVPFYGKRLFVDNVERCMGHVRLAKDAQRLKNMQVSKLAEIASLGSVEKPIFTPEQMAGNQLLWAEDNVKQFPYLLVNPVTDASGQSVPAGPVGYTKSPQIPPATAAILAVVEQDMTDVLGGQQGGEKLVSNVSGKAVEMIQQQISINTAIYVQNFAKAIKRCGVIWLSMAAELYSEAGRKMKVVTAQDKPEQITLNSPTIGENGEIEYENDLSEADFDVAVDVGPTSESKRQAIVRQLTSVLTVMQDPADRKILAAEILFNIEGEGMADIREFYRKQLVSMGVLKPTDEEAAAMAQSGSQPDPQTVLAMAMAEQAQAEAAGARAKTIKTVREAEKTAAETANIDAKTAEIVGGIMPMR